jgi:hypothetical protein
MLFILVHSPLVGPYTWEAVAGELRGRGHQVVVPSLLDVLDRSSGYAVAIAERVAQAVGRVDDEDPLLLVAHSAAGAYVPVIGEAVGRPLAGYLFVDARLPRDGGSLFDDSSPDEVERQRDRAVEGWLPPWAEWFGEEAMRGVLPDDGVRQRFVAELRPVPLALFEEPVPSRPGWPDAPCGYLRLSPSYGREVAEARAKGWPVLELEAGHLHMLVEPEMVTRAILELAGHCLTINEGVIADDP